MSQIRLLEPSVPAPQADFLGGGGQMGEAIRRHDWSATALGPPSGWPQSLRIALGIMLGSRYPMFIWWGPELIKFYNDAYIPALGGRHPRALGQPAPQVWHDIWDTVGPQMRQVIDAGIATWNEELLLVMERHGYPEETFFTYSYSPIMGDDGRISGLFCACNEDTRRVLGERRLRVLKDLGAKAPGTESVGATAKRLLAVLDSHNRDVPFAAVYLGEEAPRLAARTAALESVEILDRIGADDARWPVAAVAASRLSQQVEASPAGLGSLRSGPWSGTVQQAYLMPLLGGGQSVLGVLALGLSSHRPFDADYRNFCALVASQFAASLADAQAYEAERRRAEALAEIDRAKTAFFSNVSHEFRTPLTLMLGPVREAADNPNTPPLVRAQLELAHRNSLRLLKLVNSLLDFSRLEAGRVQAAFEPVDLPALTRDLASTFRSAIERAGLRLEVDCAPLAEAVWVDRDMWEKIVLNLLSNAFKFTFEGRIAVLVRCQGGHAVLEVTDTGVGIPPAELPHVFERFHRVEGTPGRTQEGSGIGLSLVQELVKLHGGTLEVSSEPGAGSTFRISVPFGHGHIPAERRRAARGPVATTIGAQAYVQEALRWLPGSIDESGILPLRLALDDPHRVADRRFASTFGARVVLADDNADMRAYVRELLSPHYAVEAVPDGEAALAAIRRSRPQLVLSDIMMPRLDGFGLLRALRGDAALRDVPIVLLSARAGEEARIEGLDAGADDYLVKPFAARELLARVGALLELTRIRRESEQALAEREEQLRLATEAGEVAPWNVDLVNGTVSWSPRVKAMFGVGPDAPVTLRDFEEGLHPQDRERVSAAFAAACDPQQRALYDVEYRTLGKEDGRTRWVAAKGRGVFDSTGRCLRVMGVAIDITGRKAIELALQEADRRKDVFLATLSHELRNPLGPIRTAAELLARPALDSGQLAWARGVIQRQVKQMGLLLDDLLDLSRITQGKVGLRRERVSLAAIVDNAVEAARPLLDRKQHRLAVNLPAPGVEVDADPLRLAQVLSNLLTNGAKYTDPGGRIELTAAVDGADLELAVADTGIGIPAQDLPELFAMFKQVDSGRERAEGGLGIGLALARGWIELHGGRIEAQSDGPGRGSTFVASLPGVVCPRQPPDSAAARESESEVPRPRRILVVDDNQDAADALGMLLQLAGHEVRTAYNGPAALARAPGFCPEYAILDIGMPGMDGYALARALRSQPWAGDLCLVALSGWGQDSDRERAFAAGFDHHLTKPIDPERLEALLVGRAGG